MDRDQGLTEKWIAGACWGLVRDMTGPARRALTGLARVEMEIDLRGSTKELRDGRARHFAPVKSASAPSFWHSPSGGNDNEEDPKTCAAGNSDLH